jgi:hypothetical protein
MKVVSVVVVSFALTIASGCAEKISRSGFLTRYPKFIRPGPEGRVDIVYIKEGVDFSSYNKLIIEHVEFYFREDAQYKGIQSYDLKELSDAFHKAAVEELADAYPLVDKPGSDVLRLRLALTDVFPKKPVLKKIPSIPDLEKMITVMSSGMAIRMSGDIATGYTYMGKVAMEAELLDSLTNEQLAVAIDRKTTETLKEIVKKWEHVEDAFRFWAKQLRIFLDKEHGKKAVRKRIEIEYVPNPVSYIKLQSKS